MEYELPGVQPFGSRHSWHGEVLSFEDADNGPVPDENPASVVWAQEDPHDGWEGSCACVCLLNDGRFAAWETYWGPTGDGFSEDAYGGDANIIVATTLLGALRYGLSPETRSLALHELGLVLPDEDDNHAKPNPTNQGGGR